MKHKGWLLAVVLVVLLAALAACGGSDDEGKSSTNSAASTASYTTLDVRTAYQRFEANENAIMVDVREPNEWATTGVPVGARLISLGVFTEQGAPAELPKDQEIYIICNSGNRSRVAADVLVKSGYGQVYNVDGGIQAWLAAGLPVETYTP